MATMGWGATLYPTPDTSWNGAFADKLNNNNITSVNDPEINRLIELYDTFGAEETQKRADCIRAIDGRLAALYPYVMFWYAPYTRYLYWNNFSYPECGKTRVLDTHDVERIWWWDAEKAKKVAAGRKDKSIILASPKSTSIKYWKALRKKQS